ncbi:MAG: hypothetical protein M3354_06135 [Chloroflexota bacterium]|nr:hypothetical protein [Chloroflexota bacterium]
MCKIRARDERDDCFPRTATRLVNAVERFPAGSGVRVAVAKPAPQFAQNAAAPEFIAAQVVQNIVPLGVARGGSPRPRR